MQHDPAAAIAAELERIHLALREGRLQGLADSTALLEAALAALTEAAPETLALLHRKARRNAACLEAAGRGLRAARRRLAEIKATEGLVTYDSHGKRDEAQRPAGLLAQRL